MEIILTIIGIIVGLVLTGMLMVYFTFNNYANTAKDILGFIKSLIRK